MKLKEITDYLESLAPLSSQESYDNSGLIVGDPTREIRKALITLDCLESTVEEAIEKGCELIISHHPIVFKGLKRLNGIGYVQRTVEKAIKNEVALYAIHTNLDNYRFGVNAEIGERLGLNKLRILAPKRNVLSKLAVFVPVEYMEQVRLALFRAGAGEIGNYREASFTTGGTGTYMPQKGASPFEGVLGKRSEVEEVKLEVLIANHRVGGILQAMKASHPYEEVAYEIYPIVNENPYEGSGMIGELPDSMGEVDFLTRIKKTFQCGVIRHTKLFSKPVRKVAFCGGAGSFLLKDALREGADVFITADYKYHEFFDADGKIIIADIGHFESEQYTSHRIAKILTKKFPTFAVHLTEVNTNPINYF